MPSKSRHDRNARNGCGTERYRRRCVLAGGGGQLLRSAKDVALHPENFAKLVTYDWSIALILSILIGAVTLTGSFVAVGKLKAKLVMPTQ